MSLISRGLRGPHHPQGWGASARWGEAAKTSTPGMRLHPVTAMAPWVGVRTRPSAASLGDVPRPEQGRVTWDLSTVLLRQAQRGCHSRRGVGTELTQRGGVPKGGEQRRHSPSACRHTGPLLALQAEGAALSEYDTRPVPALSDAPSGRKHPRKEGRQHETADQEPHSDQGSLGHQAEGPTW